MAIVYYIVRDVVPGTPCSHKPGRALTSHHSYDANESRRMADCFNQHVMVTGIRYSVLPWEETAEGIPVDYFGYK